MSFAKLSDIARKALREAQGLGFDQLTVTAVERRLVGVRIVQGVVCRENIARDESGFELKGVWQGREAALACQAASEDELRRRLAQLRHDVALQPPDKEFVPAATPLGSLVWDVARASLDELYGPDVLYPLIAKHAARAREQGVRVTGYVEAQEVHQHAFSHGPHGAFDLRTKDNGLILTLTVDDPRTGAVGATSRASVHAPRAELDRLLGEALDEAMELCRAGARPTELAPGDYTVVLHPAAVLDVLNTTLMYGLWDRRKIDEKRTYLSGKLDELRFPEGLRLAQTRALPLPGGVYADLPLNARHVPVGSLELITQGRIRDLHVSPYWAQRTGTAETCTAGGGPPLLLEAKAGSALAGKHRTLAELIADTGRGVYVANTWYLRMVAEMDGTITGMTRDGVFRIENGKLAGPLLNLRWHENPFRVLSAVSGVSDARTVLGRARLAGGGRAGLAQVPALRVEDFHFSSTTRF